MAAQSTDTTQRSDDPRDQMAAQVVSNYAAWTAVAGVTPIPVANVIAIGTLQLAMLRRLSQIYGTHFTDDLGKSVLASLAGSVLPASLAPSAVYGVSSLLNGFPIISASLSSLAFPALSAGSTYAIGKVFIQHFASGGSLLNFNPHDYREYMQAQAAKRANAPSAPAVASA